MKPLSACLALKNSFNFIKNNYLRLIALPLLGYVFVLIIGSLFSIIFMTLYNFNIFTDAMPGQNTLPLPWASWTSQQFTLPKVSISAGLLVCLGVFSILLLLTSLHVSTIRAVVLDQKINLNLLRLCTMPETLRLARSSFFLVLALACLAVLLLPLILVFDNKLWFSFFYGLALFSLIVYLITRFSLGFAGIAVGEVTSWREAFSLSRGQSWAVFGTILITGTLILLMQGFIKQLKILIGNYLLFETLLGLCITVLTLPLGTLLTLSIAHLYKQYRQQTRIENSSESMESA